MGAARGAGSEKNSHSCTHNEKWLDSDHPCHTLSPHFHFVVFSNLAFRIHTRSVLMPSTFAFKCSIYVSVTRFIRQDVIQRAVPAVAVESDTKIYLRSLKSFWIAAFVPTGGIVTGNTLSRGIRWRWSFDKLAKKAAKSCDDMTVALSNTCYHLQKRCNWEKNSIVIVDDVKVFHTRKVFCAWCLRGSF